MSTDIKKLNDEFLNAVRLNAIPGVKATLGREANPDAQDARGYNALMIAMESIPELPDCIQMMAILLEKGANINLVASAGTALGYALQGEFPPERRKALVEFLLLNHAALDTQQSFQTDGAGCIEGKAAHLLVPNSPLGSFDSYKASRKRKNREHSVLSEEMQYSFFGFQQAGVYPLQIWIAKVKANETAITQHLLDCYSVSGQKLFRFSKNEYSILHFAAMNPDERVLMDLLTTYSELKSQINRPGENGITPLHIAAANSNSKVAEILIQQGAHVEALSTSGISPLLIAVAKGHVQVVEMLIARGVSASLATPYGLTPLHIAVVGNHLTLIDLLLKRGAEVDASMQMNGMEISPLSLSVLENSDLSVAERFIPHSLNMGKQYSLPDKLSMSLFGHSEPPMLRGNTLFHMAAENKQIGAAVIDCVMKHHANFAEFLIHTRNSLGQTPLHTAVNIPENANVIEMLIKQDVSLRNNEEMRKIIDRVRQVGDIENMKALIRCQVNFDYTDANGKNIFHVLSTYHYINVPLMACLLTNLPNAAHLIKQLDHYQKTPLDEAIDNLGKFGLNWNGTLDSYQNCLCVVILLILKGARTHAPVPENVRFSMNALSKLMPIRLCWQIWDAQDSSYLQWLPYEVMQVTLGLLPNTSDSEIIEMSNEIEAMVNLLEQSKNTAIAQQLSPIPAFDTPNPNDLRQNPIAVPNQPQPIVFNVTQNFFPPAPANPFTFSGFPSVTNYLTPATMYEPFDRVPPSMPPAYSGVLPSRSFSSSSSSSSSSHSVAFFPHEDFHFSDEEDDFSKNEMYSPTTPTKRK